MLDVISKLTQKTQSITEASSSLDLQTESVKSLGYRHGPLLWHHTYRLAFLGALQHNLRAGDEAGEREAEPLGAFRFSRTFPEGFRYPMLSQGKGSLG